MFILNLEPEINSQGKYMLKDIITTDGHVPSYMQLHVTTASPVAEIQGLFPGYLLWNEVGKSADTYYFVINSLI